MIKIQKSYNIQQIQAEVEQLLDDHSGNFETQLLLQSPDGTDWYTTLAPYNIKPGLTELDFNVANVPADWEVTRFINENNLCRTRIMILPFRKCYSWHKDVGSRMHLAVKTNEQCFFVEHNQLVNIPADGYPYLLDVSDYHTAMNCSELAFDRIHIVGVFR